MKQRAEHRRQGDRDSQAYDHYTDDDHNQLAEQQAGGGRNDQNRHAQRDERNRGGCQRRADLPGGLERYRPSAAIRSFAPQAGYIFYHDDRIIHNNAHGYDQPAKRKYVQGESGQVHEGEVEDERDCKRGQHT